MRDGDDTPYCFADWRNGMWLDGHAFLARIDFHPHRFNFIKRFLINADKFKGYNWLWLVSHAWFNFHLIVMPIVSVPVILTILFHNSNKNHSYVAIAINNLYQMFYRWTLEIVVIHNVEIQWLCITLCIQYITSYSMAIPEKLLEYLFVYITYYVNRNPITMQF